MNKLLRIIQKDMIGRVRTPWYLTLDVEGGVHYEISSDLGIITIASKDKESIYKLIDKFECGKILIIDNDMFYAHSKNEYEDKLLKILPNSLEPTSTNIIKGMKLIRDIVNSK